MNTTHPQSDRLDAVALMCDRAVHQGQSQSIKLLETHISWLFVTEAYVYKLKKPVRFDFVDFSTPELRHRACLEEVRLNRRLSPDVYLGVVPITQASESQLELDGTGEPVDWVVRMRRLRADDAFDYRLSKGEVTGDDERAVAERLTNFYRGLPAEIITGHEYRAALERNVRSNAAACIRLVSKYDRNRVRRIFGQQLRFLRVSAKTFDERADTGRIVDGHGDLRPEHIFLESPPAVIDCIEFSPQLRQVDVLDDLSFLSMECDRLGDCDTGARIVAACSPVHGDHTDPLLIDYYKSYRALVRAKVMLLQAAQLPESARRSPMRQSHRYLDWAEHYAALLGAPVLIMVGGLMGTGKSTLAAQVARAIGANLYSTDRIRRTMYGVSNTEAGYGEGHYRTDLRARVYDELFARATHALDNDLSAVLDGTFLTQTSRQRAANLARQHGGTALYVHCHCPRQVALDRLKARAARGDSDSEGRADLFDEQAEAQDVPADKPTSVAVDTTRLVGEQLEHVFSRLAPVKDADGK
jgi:aminoglycoside phosphotransferase family enzyme/predicted kinase